MLIDMKCDAEVSCGHSCILQAKPVSYMLNQASVVFFLNVHLTEHYCLSLQGWGEQAAACQTDTHLQLLQQLRVQTAHGGHAAQQEQRENTHTVWVLWRLLIFVYSHFWVKVSLNFKKVLSLSWHAGEKNVGGFLKLICYLLELIWSNFEVRNGEKVHKELRRLVFDLEIIWSKNKKQKELRFPDTDELVSLLFHLHVICFCLLFLHDCLELEFVW